MSAAREKFLQYGVSSELADKALDEDLTVTAFRNLSKKILRNKYDLSDQEIDEIKKAVQRQPIEVDVLHALLERSNYTCNVCKGVKSHSFVVHHIEPYEKSQNNKYENLIVLCPNDHDRAHGSGLSMRISEQELRNLKQKWEAEVEVRNAAKAARAVEVEESAIDYFNIRRIEELCLKLFRQIPKTSMSASLAGRGIINESGNFQQRYVAENLSNGRYLFDYINAGEALHYKELMEHIAKEVEFADLAEAIQKGKKAVKQLEGAYAFFIGGVYSKQPKFPIDSSTPDVLMHYQKNKIRVEWILDPNFFFSSSAITRQGSKNRYIIYCLIRTVEANSQTNEMLVKASPLLIAQPSKYVDRTPPIGWASKYGMYFGDGEDDDFWGDDE